LADLDTPVSLFSRVADDPCAYLLESVEGGERWGRFSYIGFHPRAVFTVENGQPRLRDAAGESRPLPVPPGQPPLFALRELLHREKPVPLPGLPHFIGGAVGYLGYETVRGFEPRLPAAKPAPAGAAVPEACFLLIDQLAIVDNVRHTLKLVVCARPREHASPEAAYDDACRKLAAMAARLRSPQPAPAPGRHAEPPPVSSNLTREAFTAAVRRIKEYIQEGDIIQAVFSQRFETKLTAPPLDLYRALRLINPSPYTFFLTVNGVRLVGASPELLVRLTGSTAETRPIAGTRPRGRGEQEDVALADELLRDEKERAEHVMLVDLGRNDLGRVCAAGSVQVRDFMAVERYSHVMHLVSHVHGQLKPGLDAFDLLAATFPAGTLSGAPKVRAMEIIHELEPQARGPYGGAVGYFGYDGGMDLAITIRTFQLTGDRVLFQAGAGIVADSDPEKEYEETVNKAQGLMRALELAGRGLELA
jgi:anthranilate synthase component 1